MGPQPKPAGPAVHALAPEQTMIQLMRYIRIMYIYHIYLYIYRERERDLYIMRVFMCAFFGWERVGEELYHQVGASAGAGPTRWCW